jgi:hypothetical protein
MAAVWEKAFAEMRNVLLNVSAENKHHNKRIIEHMSAQLDVLTANIAAMSATVDAIEADVVLVKAKVDTLTAGQGTGDTQEAIQAQADAVATLKDRVAKAGDALTAIAGA